MNLVKSVASLGLLILLSGVEPVYALTMEPRPIPLADPYMKCYQKPERGPCKAMFEKYYYNYGDRKCASFFWGGCQGVVPFETIEECEKECLALETLTITKLHGLNDIYLQASLEFPKAWEAAQFQVRVDGKEVNAKRHSGGFSQDRRMASLLFFPGKPGVKEISVHAKVAGKTIQASQSVNWPGRPFAALLQYAGDRLLVTDKNKIRLITANIENVIIKINGEGTNPEILGRDAALFSIDPAWRPGRNTVSVEGKGADGSPVSKSHTFIYPGDTIKQGEAMLLDFGTEGTKSGPFFSVSVEGDAIASGKDSRADSFILDNEGWIGTETRLVRELKAVRPGQAKILIFEKPHFLQERRLIREIILRVIPASGG